MNARLIKEALKKFVRNYYMGLHKTLYSLSKTGSRLIKLYTRFDKKIKGVRSCLLLLPFL